MVGVIIIFAAGLCTLSLIRFDCKGITPIPSIFRNKLKDDIFPLQDIVAIIIADNGQIYLSNMCYGRIEIYDNKGNYLDSWFVETQGKYEIWYEKGLVHIFQWKIDYYDVFDLNGKLVSHEEVESYKAIPQLRTRAGTLEASDKSGNTYHVESENWSPRVIKTTAQGQREVIIATPPYLKFMTKPEKTRYFIIVFIVFAAHFLSVSHKKYTIGHAVHKTVST